MKVKQKFFIVFLMLIIPCLTMVGMYIKEYVHLNKQTFINNDNNKEKSKMISIMYETKTGDYVESSETAWPLNGYIFNEKLSRCENGSKLTWDDVNQEIQLNSKISDKCYVYFDIKPTFAEQIQSIYVNNDPDQTLLYHDGTMENGIDDKSYRYSGANPNNFVCFGTNAEQCPDDNLYRIIGIFDDDGDGIYNIKVIKYDYATSDQLGTDGDYYRKYILSLLNQPSTYKGTNYSNVASFYWNASLTNGGTGTNTWSESRLNIINLNTNFTRNIGSEWLAKIVDTAWKTGGASSTALEDLTPASAYNTGKDSLTYNAKIGLLYSSDYGFAASQGCWGSNLNVYNLATITQNNWMYMGLTEWTIAKTSLNTLYVFSLEDTGNINVKNVTVGTYGAVRPVFNLESFVELKLGSGTYTDPCRI